MLTLYALPISLYSAKTRIALRCKGLDWTELLPPGGYGSAEYKALVASGNLPALDHDGLLLADSEAIAEYLEDRFPDPPLLPSAIPDRAKMRERSRFHDTRLEPALRALFPHLDSDKRDPGLFARQSQALTDRLAQLARLLAEGPDLPFGMGDCGLPVTFLWIRALTPRLGLEIDWPRAVLAYRDRIGGVPAVGDELAVYAPTLTAYLDRRGV